MAFSWDLAAQRYRGPSGRFVPEVAVRQAVDTVVDAGVQRVAALTERLRAGAIDLPTWQQEAARIIKELHLEAAAAAKGGWAQMSQADYGWTGSRLKEQYRFLANFAAEVASGRQPLDGRAVNRARLYGEAARLTYQEAHRREGRLRGATQERWLTRATESCAGCVSQAARGWVRSGSLPALGGQPCRSRCRCVVQTRRVQTEAA